MAVRTADEENRSRLTNAEIMRYGRQLILPEIGVRGILADVNLDENWPSSHHLVYSRFANIKFARSSWVLSPTFIKSVRQRRNVRVRWKIRSAEFGKWGVWRHFYGKCGVWRHFMENVTESDVIGGLVYTVVKHPKPLANWTLVKRLICKRLNR